MPLVLENRVQETATANTTVSFTLTGAVTGFQTFAAIGNTNTTYYSATDSAGNFEVGLGTYSTTGPTLTRTTVYASSNANNPVTFSGTVNVFVTYPSGRSVNLDASGNVSALGTVSSGAWQGTTIGVAYGGTGQSTATAAFNALAPSQTSNSGKYLTTNGTDTSWVSPINPITINSTTITTAINIASGENGFSVGPMTVGTGGSVTVASGQQWVVF
jgi:hypothetical protein